MLQVMHQENYYFYNHAVKKKFELNNSGNGKFFDVCQVKFHS